MFSANRRKNGIRLLTGKRQYRFFVIVPRDSS